MILGGETVCGIECGRWVCAEEVGILGNNEEVIRGRETGLGVG